MPMDIVSFRVELLHQGTTEDLVDLELSWAQVSYGLAGPPTKTEVIRCRVPVPRGEIRERIEAAKEPTFAVEDSGYPSVSSTGIRVELVQHRILEIRQEKGKEVF